MLWVKVVDVLKHLRNVKHKLSILTIFSIRHHGNWIGIGTGKTFTRTLWISSQMVQVNVPWECESDFVVLTTVSFLGILERRLIMWWDSNHHTSVIWTNWSMYVIVSVTHYEAFQLHQWSPLPCLVAHPRAASHHQATWEGGVTRNRGGKWVWSEEERGSSQEEAWLQHPCLRPWWSAMDLAWRKKEWETVRVNFWGRTLLISHL